jgi:hypothetical protein
VKIIERSWKGTNSAKSGGGETVAVAALAGQTCGDDR